MSAVPPQKPVLGVIDAEKWYGAQLILKGVSLTVNEGDRLGLIGRNGCGKSTLMRIMAGVEAVDAGEVTRARGLRAAHKPQARVRRGSRRWKYMRSLE